MASASHNTIMRELSAAGDRERTGAFDVEWEGARASLFFIFGHANHVELERAGGEKLVGTEALTAIVEELPDEFRVSPWRRAMVTDDTLRCTAEELMFMFRRDPAKSAGREPAEVSADDAPADESASPAPEPDAASPVAASPIPFGLADFPVLPHGDPLFSDSAENVEGLAGAVPHLPDSLILLDGPDARGAVLVGGGAVVDAVWVDETTCLRGHDAADAVFSATAGTLAAYRVDDPDVFSEMRSLWTPEPTAVEPADACVTEADVTEADVTAADVTAADVTDDAVTDVDVEDAVVAEPFVAEAPPTPHDSAAFFADTRAEREPAVFTLPDASTAAAPEVAEAEVAAPDDAGPEVTAHVEPDDFEPETAAAAATGDEALAAPPTDAGLTSSAAEFVPARVDVDIDALRAELVGIADVWLGEVDAAPVAAAIRSARPGVDDFVAAIQAIASLDIPGHEHAVVRAMAREMHFRAAEVLCGV